MVPPLPDLPAAPPHRAPLKAAAVLALIALAVAFVAVALRPGAPSRDRLARYRLGEIQGALEVFRVAHGRYPTSEEGLAPLHDARQWPPILERAPADPWGHPFAYARLDEVGYLVASPGPDGVFGTDDDVSVRRRLGDETAADPVLGAVEFLVPSDAGERLPAR